MKKQIIRILKYILTFILSIIIIYGIGRFVVVMYDSYIFVDRQPYLLMQTQNSISIKWQTPDTEIGEVSYSKNVHNLSNIKKDSIETNKHFIKLENLKQCTKYYYKVKSKSLNIDNTNRSFSTLCKQKDSLKIWVIGDSGKKGKKQKKVYKQMQKYIDNDFNNLDMWLLLGDNAYSSGKQKQYNKKLFKPYKEMVKRFVPWAVVGNHDARRFAFYNIWDFPTNAESGGLASGSEKFYSIENASLHLVMLDSETVSRDKNTDMAKWLRNDLMNNKKPWVIVAFHTPPYTKGGHDSDNKYDSWFRMKEMRETFVPIFDEFGVDLVLSGHSHNYERSKLIKEHTLTSDTFNKKINIVQDSKNKYFKNIDIKKNSGTIYLVSGSSSRIGYGDLNHPALPFSFGLMGSLIIDITPNSLSSKFLTINGNIADEFTIYKNIKED